MRNETTVTDTGYEIDFSDHYQLKMLMRKYGDYEGMFPATNEHGEKQNISFYPDKIELVTFQYNGYERQNTYWYDGTSEETFNGRWK